MTLPNFIVIGAARSGTTALYYYLKQHPQIYMSPVKEPRFFAFEKADLQFCGPGDAELHRSSIINLETYQSLFQGVSNEVAIGEASPVYLCSPKAADRMKAYVPNVKLIAILRHPVERAYSHFLHLVRDGEEPLTDFAQALQAEEARVHNNWEFRWRYTQLGFYASQLQSYFNSFDRHQIKIYLYEDFETNPGNVLYDIFRFLGVDNIFIPDTSIRYNASGIPRNEIIHTILSRLQKVTQKTFDGVPGQESNPRMHLTKRLSKLLFLDKARRIGINLKNQNLVKPQLAPEIRKQLVAVYREDILALQGLIQRDLSHWLE
jgi:hypothetical protein